MAQDHEQHKERLRAAGRRALEEFRRQKGERTAAAARVSGPVAGSAPAPSPPASVELATFRVYTRPAAAETGLTRPSESSELRLLASALASTSLGPLPPGSACIPPPAPPSSCPSSAASVTGATSLRSLGSTATGYSAPPSVAPAGGASAGHSPPAATRQLSVPAEDQDVRLQGYSPRGAGGDGAGGGDQAMVDMLLGQVSALMRDKAALAAENASLRQQVEQLTELVGWLSLERGEAERQETGEGEEAGPSGEQQEQYGQAEAYGFGEESGSGTPFGTWPVEAAVEEGGGVRGGDPGDACGVLGCEADVADARVEQGPGTSERQSLGHEEAAEACSEAGSNGRFGQQGGGDGTLASGASHERIGTQPHPLFAG